MLKLLLSFDGRLSRKRFWLGEVLSVTLLAPALADGKVDILFFTDAQYGNINSYRGKGKSPRPGVPDQLQLF